ncbi:alpha-ketoglutarate-dependent dioxygenase alkB homolog 6 [Daktulosphaira vitifoliae]|uniref:alpha-ketoglutarate-dependent dioxygenase alkB homolog 6 n=1 Tax=Daktulosphaira vitifoliae TaxID=58002 RepID=UPI0021A9DBE9|nr:alpha-ketoglutarate-dependent dioxygenase alkB homolog 6 [Daktulosphaira vitifoliae]
MTSLIDLNNYKLSNICDNVFYIPNYVSEEQEKYIIDKVNEAPKPKWTQLRNRRLQNWGGVPHVKGLIPENIPNWLNGFLKQISNLGVFPGSNQPNHILVNEYLPGQGIMPHLDGSLFYPTITTISCGSQTVLNFYSANEIEGQTSNMTKKMYSLLLERRSLLILQEKMYNEYLHGIDELKEDVVDKSLSNINSCSSDIKINSVIPRGTRVSLTIRNIPKISKINLNSLMKK